MPIFEYDCLDCGRRVELFLRNREEQPRCPECGSTYMRKAFSVFAAKGKSGPGGAPVAPT